ncbi:hypothetical protein GIB67_003306 [Kingdonia uniflora]|uniref:Uncharacterized protein n=1 Tax=Kingdonia uniflora TaxID=39325 RepID=A0A7J7P9F6_9MAGN|nr:hypothetical protein GIB67_003306 [Kingdonia uniflora]
MRILSPESKSPSLSLLKSISISQSLIETQKSSSSSSAINDSLRFLVWNKACDFVASFIGTSLGRQATKAQLLSLNQSFVESKRLLVETNAVVEMLNYGGSGGMDFSGIDVALIMKLVVNQSLVKSIQQVADEEGSVRDSAVRLLLLSFRFQLRSALHFKSLQLLILVGVRCKY